MAVVSEWGVCANTVGLKTTGWLRSHTALPENQALVSRTHIRWLTTICSSSSWGSDSCALWRHLHSPLHTNTQTDIQLNIIKVLQKNSFPFLPYFFLSPFSSSIPPSFLFLFPFCLPLLLLFTSSSPLFLPSTFSVLKIAKHLIRHWVVPNPNLHDYVDALL